MKARKLRISFLLVLFAWTVIGAEDSSVVQTHSHLHELTLHELTLLKNDAKVFLSPEVLQLLKQQLKKTSEEDKVSEHFITGEQVHALAETGIPASPDLLAALRLANASVSKKDLPVAARKVLIADLEEWKLSPANPILLDKNLTQKVNEVVGGGNDRDLTLGDIKEFGRKIAGKETRLTEDEWRDLLGLTRLNLRSLVGPEFLHSFGKEVKKRSSDLFLERDALKEKPVPAKRAEGEAAPDSLPGIENKGTPTPGKQKTKHSAPELLLPERSEGPSFASNTPVPGTGLKNIGSGAPISPSFFNAGSSGTAPRVVFRKGSDSNSGTPDGKMGVVGANPPDSVTRNALLGALDEKRALGEDRLSTDMTTLFPLSGKAACKMTNLKKVFNGFSCEAVFATAKHCTQSSETGERAAEFDLGAMGSFQVTPRGGIGSARVESPQSGGRIAGADIAAIHVEKPGHCPSDSEIPTFKIAYRQPTGGVILDGQDLVIGGIKESGSTLLEVNLNDPANRVGIYPGNSGGGSFNLDPDGQLVFNGIISAKFTASQFADRLGLVEGQGPVQEWFREQVEGKASYFQFADNNPPTQRRRPHQHVH